MSDSDSSDLPAADFGKMFASSGVDPAISALLGRSGLATLSPGDRISPQRVEEVMTEITKALLSINLDKATMNTILSQIRAYIVSNFAA